MLPLRVYQAASRLHPRVNLGRLLHRRALALLAVGAPLNAEPWFEAAAGCYRRELAIEPLARLRVHQLMARSRTERGEAGEACAMIEIVRRLSRLDQLERLESPFELCDARVVLADWIERCDSHPAPPLRFQSPNPQAA